MNKKFYKNEKFQKTFYGVFYFVIVCLLVVSGVIAFDRFYYEHIYVSGSSMLPTLLGGSLGPENRCHYGDADRSARTIDSLSRFDVVITYFPKSWTGDEDTYKIKRVWGFPGETITLNYTMEDGVELVNFRATNPRDNQISIYKGTISYNETVKIESTEFTSDFALFDIGKKSFRVNVASKRSFNYTLNSDEYFLMGDNWPSSSDSYANYEKKSSDPERTYITRGMLQGKVVRMLGTAIYKDGQLFDKRKINGMFEF